MKLLRQILPEPQQLALGLDFAPSEGNPQRPVDRPAPKHETPRSVSPGTPTLFPGPTPGTTASSTPRRRIHVGSHILEYRLLRSKRRSIGFLIDDDGLRITAPRWVTIAEIEGAIQEKQRWIFAKLTERRERSARRLQAPMVWQDGAKLPYLGGDIVLQVIPALGTGIAFDAEAARLTVCLPPEAGEQQLKDRVQGWLQSEAKRIFAERLPVYAEKLGVTYRQFALSSAATQWGSCTSDGRIRLNWRLIHFAPPLIDYVIAHELSHLREMNHSPRFWATVQSVFPEFAAAKRALRDHSPEALPLF
ncbi:hypothetical protein SAMN06265795_11549 [Noviherbaspirillum humi]|uniref:YgjP-like metallopeptidase domain-containing protein n=1 Tax=Noviherbaspirillum humi TaxID=1688639 RepID=A0A239K8X8_9BURK|nr:SprT family zinc-dependent metalloprotease [Noviherbaspirillum humi]SNT14837.1 hypothetical protein SAMN06265795_11549 [Noviherbaspirillum humi]